MVKKEKEYCFGCGGLLKKGKKCSWCEGGKMRDFRGEEIMKKGDWVDRTFCIMYRAEAKAKKEKLKKELLGLSMTRFQLLMDCIMEILKNVTKIPTVKKDLKRVVKK